MGTMTVEDVIGIYTVADLERAREREIDDASRWELIEGELAMTPSPLTVHQELVGRLYARLLAVGGDLRVIVAPLDVHLSAGSVLQPDVVVAEPDQVMEDGVHGAPVLAVEVLSPATRRRDLVQKRSVLEQAGCPHYWALDPDTLTLWAWRLVDGAYVLEHQVGPTQRVTLSAPVPITLRPADLLPPSP